MLKWIFDLIQSKTEAKKENFGQLGAQPYKKQKKAQPPPRSINDYQERFRTSLVGTWGEAHDSEFVGDIWEFAADHTGKVEQTNFLGTVNSEVVFEWKEIADFTIAIKLILWDQEVMEPEEGEEEWDIVRYGFTSQFVKNEGPTLVLCGLSKSGEILNSFWIFKGPLVRYDHL